MEQTAAVTITRLTPEVGDIVIDASISDTYGPRYAIGKTGFLNLDTGDFASYDSDIPGPKFFDRPEFIIESTQRKASMSHDAAAALTEADYQFDRLTHAKSLPEQGQALIDLSNAMSNLRTWHPGYVFDDATGGTLPWQREQN